jgi:hypothetical protein
MRTMGLLERMGISIGNNTVFVVEGLSATVKRFRNFGVLLLLDVIPFRCYCIKKDVVFSLTSSTIFHDFKLKMCPPYCSSYRSGGASRTIP